MACPPFQNISNWPHPAREVYRWGHSEFRVERRSFASLGGPADTVATLNLTSEQQAAFMDAAPRVFEPVAGDWGRLGSTKLLLAAAEEVMVQSAIEAAWRNVAPKPPLKRKKRADKPPRS